MDEQIIADVEQWLDEVVIGLDLCPFAARPRREKRVRIAVSHATDEEALLNDLQADKLYGGGAEGYTDYPMLAN